METVWEPRESEQGGWGGGSQRAGLAPESLVTKAGFPAWS